jgi:hypothetical protein
MNHPSVGGSPTVITCEGFTIPVTDRGSIGIDRVAQGRYAVIVESGDETYRLAELDSFRDALDAHKALDLLLSVLFPSVVE